MSTNKVDASTPIPVSKVTNQVLSGQNRENIGN
jgi:hypothetical protein